MSNIRHAYITTKTAACTLELNEMGEIIVNKSSSLTITLPTAVGNRGLWYRFINIGAGTMFLSTSGFLLKTGESGIVMSDGSDWIHAANTTSYNVTEHLDSLVTDSSGAHGMCIDSTPVDGYFLKWSEDDQMYIHALP